MQPAIVGSTRGEAQDGSPVIEVRGLRKTFGSFVALYGIDETRTLISRALDGSLD